MLRFILLVGWLAAAHRIGTAQPCQLPPLAGNAGVPGAGELFYCAPEKPPAPSASLAVLVDDSGSMAGHRAVMPQVLAWLEQASSRLAARGLNLRDSRGCYFSSARPLAQCKDPRPNPRAFQGRGATTLNLAIEFAARFDLAVIITDGVGNVGGGPACAAGVDAACLAASLAAALRPRGGEPRTILPGLWIVPLISLFDGTLFTEQAFPPEQFDVQRVTTNVTADTGLAAVVRNPKLDASGLLAYDYRGPRAFLAIVIARPAELGRALLGAMAAAGPFSNVVPAISMKGSPQGLAFLRPIEIFPGIAPRVSGFTAATLDPKACRTLSSKLAGEQLHIDCPNTLDQGTVYLTAQAAVPSSECLVIQSLPAHTLRLESAGAPVSPILDSRWTGSATDPARPLGLSLRLQCRRSWSLPCPKQGLEVSWRVSFDYRATPSRLLAPARFPAERALAEISATSVIQQPHRLLQLRETLESFYRTVALTWPSAGQDLARLTLCKP